MKKGLILAATLLAGCVLGGSQPTQWIDSRYSMVWPQPPDVPKYRFLRSLQGPGDFSVSSTLGRFFGWFSGGEIEKNPSLQRPYAVAADGLGRVWVADTGTSLVHLFDLKRQRVGYISSANGVPFSLPSGVAYDPVNDRLYVSDAFLGKVFSFQSDGVFVAEVSMPGGFQRPAGLTVDRLGRLYVVDVFSDSVSIFSSEGVYLQTITGGEGETGFNNPLFVSVDTEGRIYVNDSLNFHIDIFDSQGDFLMRVGNVGDAPGSFARPRGVAVDLEGHLYVADAAFDNIQLFDSEGDILFYFGSAGPLPGLFSMPSGLFVDTSGRLYVADTQNHRVQVFQYLSQNTSTN